MPTVRPRALFVVPCGRAKLAQRAPARHLYTGSMFRWCLRVVEQEARLTAAVGIDASVLILSARHGLITPDTLIAPYDQVMADPTSIPASMLAQQVSTYLTTSDCDFYAFLPRAYGTRLQAAVNLLGHPDEPATLVHDVYEAALGIGFQRKVIASIARTHRPHA